MLRKSREKKTIFANFLIGLREGLEAVLIITILLAYLYKTGRSEFVRFIWIGASTAILLSIGLGTFFTKSSYYLTFEAQETLGGALSLITVGLVTWMIFWLASHAKDLKGQLEGSVDTALASGAVSLTLVSFLAVAREGLETALFVWTAVIATEETFSPIAGALTGIISAALLGVILYKGVVRINLKKFFFYTGFALIIVAAGVLAYGVHDLQEAGIIPGLNSAAFDISQFIPAGSWFGTILNGIFNFSPKPSIIEFGVWATYLVIILTIFIRVSSNKSIPKEEVLES